MVADTILFTRKTDCKSGFGSERLSNANTKPEIWFAWKKLSNSYRTNVSPVPSQSITIQCGTEKFPENLIRFMLFSSFSMKIAIHIQHEFLKTCLNPWSLTCHVSSRNKSHVFQPHPSDSWPHKTNDLQGWVSVFSAGWPRPQLPISPAVQEHWFAHPCSHPSPGGNVLQCNQYEPKYYLSYLCIILH